MEYQADGVLNVCKPTGMSSFKCLSIVKRKLGIKKVGHLGTLDPAACGVLVLLCGRATKLNQQLNNGNFKLENGCLILDSDIPSANGTKVYKSVFTFGIETETLDNEGEVVATSTVIPTRKQVEEVLPAMVGNIEIEVPKFSAVHINGKRAYDLARRGIDFTPPTKTVAVNRFELTHQIAPNKFFFEIECQTGTYIRSLAKLIARKLNTVAIASLIIRTRTGEFDIKDSVPLEKVTLTKLIKQPSA